MLMLNFIYYNLLILYHLALSHNMSYLRLIIYESISILLYLSYNIHDLINYETMNI